MASGVAPEIALVTAIGLHVMVIIGLVVTGVASRIVLYGIERD
jgi:hypothetical protein